MRQLDPKSVWAFFITNALSSAFMVVVAIPLALIMRSGAGPSGSLVAILLLVLIAVLALCFIWAKLTHHFYRYDLTDDGFRKERGVISKKYVTIPYDRIQNIDIYRGILDRLLGLSKLHIQTAGMSAIGPYGAGGGVSEGSLPGLSKEVAEQVRDELIQRVKQSKNQGL